ncbi:sugar ABC transporter ATP-binding protein [Candidatus Thioglobus sp.]|nr:sugar ABC transporter ATP-binding protein [Candidatus Thioglobus sp.]
MNQSSIPLLKLNNISKQFFETSVLDEVNFDLYPGEAHAIFGPNGAGKSTLIKIITGDLQPTSGKIILNNEELKIHSVHNARELGISAVFQEFSLVPQLTVEENLFLGSNVSKGLFLNKKKLHKMACETMDRLEFSIKPEEKIINLSHAEKRMVEIAKAFHTRPSIMILDEPTASLAENETNHLFSMIKILKEEGIGVIYITHRMKEIYTICNRVTILQDGKVVETDKVSKIDEQKLIELATGRKIKNFFPEIKSHPGRTLLDVKNLSITDSFLKDVSINIRAGEVVGLAGLAGSGKSAIGRACFGINKINSGNITYLDDVVYDSSKNINDISPRAMLDRGMLYVPSDRRAEGLVMEHNIRENISLPSLGLPKFSTGFMVNRKNEKDIVEKIGQRLNFNKGIENKIEQLSGGTQQKVMLAKSFARDVQLFILDEPTIGVDIGTRVSIYELISDFCDAGGAVLMISSDLTELVNLSHRIYIINEGSLSAEINSEESSELLIQNYFLKSRETEIKV